MLHRRFLIADGPDPEWSTLQTRPAPGGLVESIRGPTTGFVQWYGIGYDGGTESSNPVDMTAGLTFDARLVYAAPGLGGAALEYVGLQAISVANAGNPWPGGFAAIDQDLPQGFEAWLQVIAINNTTAATHVWFSYEFVDRVP